MSIEELGQNFGYRHSDVGLSQAGHQPETALSVQKQYADVVQTWRPPPKIGAEKI